MAISDKKRLEVANVCYASVSGLFAFFSNPRNRGPQFTWDTFPVLCEEESEIWMWRIRGNRNDINCAAKEYAGEIARSLVQRMGNVS